MSQKIRISYDFTVTFTNLNKEFVHTVKFLDIFCSSVLYKAICCLYKNIQFKRIKFEVVSQIEKGDFSFLVYREQQGYPVYRFDGKGSYKSPIKCEYCFDVTDLYRSKKFERENRVDSQNVEHVLQFRLSLDEAMVYSTEVKVNFDVTIVFGSILPSLEFSNNRFDGDAAPENVMRGFTFYSNDISSKQVGNLVSDVLTYDLKSFPSSDVVINAPAGVFWDKVIIRDARTNVEAVPPIDGSFLPSGFQFFLKQNGAVQTTQGSGCGRATTLSQRRRVLQNLVRMDFASVLPDIIKQENLPPSTTSEELTKGQVDMITNSTTPPPVLTDISSSF